MLLADLFKSLVDVIFLQQQCEQCEDFATGVKSLVENLDAATSILHQDGSETLLEPVERCRC